jgi:hypothetical protein
MRLPRAALPIVLLLAWVPRAHAQSEKEGMLPATRLHYEQGLTEFEAQHYEAAAVELKLAYTLEPRKAILFAWAQAERLRGNCSAALDLYQAYLKQDLTQTQADVARYHLARCREIVRPPWYKDVVGDVLLASGTVAIGVGTGYLLLSISDDNGRNASSVTTYDQANRLTDDARTERTVALTSLAVGGALVTGAIVRYLTRGPDRSSGGVAMWMKDQAAGIVAFGRF